MADLLDVLARAAPALLAVVGRRRLEILGDERRVVDDHGQQVVEVVGDAARELPQALQALGLVQLVLQSLPFRLRLQPLALAGRHHALAHVANCGDRQRAVIGLDARQADLGRELAAVPAAGEQLQPSAHRPRARIGEVARPMGAVRVVEALRHQHLHRLPQQVLACVSEQHLDLRVDQHDQTVATDSHDRVRGQLQQRRLRCQARGDVTVDLQQSRQLAGPVVLRRPAALDDQTAAVLGVLHQVAFPASGLGDDSLDLLER